MDGEAECSRKKGKKKKKKKKKSTQVPFDGDPREAARFDLMELILAAESPDSEESLHPPPKKGEKSAREMAQDRRRLQREEELAERQVLEAAWLAEHEDEQRHKKALELAEVGAVGGGRRR